MAAVHRRTFLETPMTPQSKSLLTSLIVGPVLWLGAAVSSGAPADDARAIVDAHYAHLETLYTHLHRNPELSLAEEKTASRLADELRDLGYAVTENVGGHGVVAVLKNGPGKVLLIRCDLDGTRWPS
jgi:hippurate hydrolase